MRIDNIQPITTLLQNEVRGAETEDSGFVDILKKAVQDVNQTQKAADIIAEKFTIGEIDNAHQVTIAAEQAKLALDLTVAIRNKVVDAYKEIMRMQF